MIQFILNYTGNKYKESKELKDIDFSKYECVIEPFSGSFGFSRWLYRDKGYKNIKYIFYDSDEELISFYNHIKKLINENALESFIDKYNEQVAYLKNNYGKEKIINTKESKKYILSIDDINIKYMIYKNCIQGIVSKVCFKYFKNLSIDDLNLLKNSDFICENFLNIDFKKYDKEKTIYLDPPYILSDNMHYEDKSLENIFESILDLYNEKYKCIFIHSYNFLLDFVFKKYHYSSYIKMYGFTRNKVSHIVYYVE